MNLAVAWATLRRQLSTAFLAGLLRSLVSTLVCISKELLGPLIAARALGPSMWRGLVGALAMTAQRPSNYRVSIACTVAVATVSASLRRAVALGCQAVRRHPFSIASTALLGGWSAGLLGASVPLALLLWIAVSLVCLESVRALEPLALRLLGCRTPSHLEGERLDQVLDSAGVEVVVLSAAEPWLGRGLRSLVLSRALLDLLEDRALTGIVAQASAQIRGASLAGEMVVWLGNLPILCAWYLSRHLVQLGRVLAIAVGASLVLPLVIWPGGFTRWGGRLLGAGIVGLFGSALLSSGLSAAGLALLLAWVVVPGLQTLLNWETRLAETAADDAMLEAGLGWELLEALETLAWAVSLPALEPPLGWLCRQASPLTSRADRIWRKLSQP